MAKELVSDELWKTIEPLLPDEPPKPKGGRPRVDNRSALAGIIFVLKSGIPWEMLPKEMGCGSGTDSEEARYQESRIARKGIESSEKLGRHRWVVERTLAWLAKYRRLTIRYERRDDIHEAFLHLGCSLICLNYLV
jgi:transposase